jgi:hypothetical protein
MATAQGMYVENAANCVLLESDKFFARTIFKNECIQ